MEDPPCSVDDPNAADTYHAVFLMKWIYSRANETVDCSDKLAPAKEINQNEGLSNHCEAPPGCCGVFSVANSASESLDFLTFFVKRTERFSLHFNG